MASRPCIHGVLAADENYAAYAGIAMLSAIRATPEACFHFHLLSDGISPPEKKRLQKALAAQGAALSVYDVAPFFEKATATNPDKRLTRATYARLFMDRFLPPDLRQAIYMDCDIVCLGSLWPLWNCGETEVAVAGAVIDRLGNTPQHKTRLRIPPSHAYFNAGVLVVNLPAWRERQIGKAALDFLSSCPAEHLYFYDQDALNAVLGAQITLLPEIWNYQLNEIAFSDAAIALATARIAHFNGRLKPWHLDGYRKGPAYRAYCAAKRHSPWRYKRPGLRIYNRLKKSLLRKVKKRQRQDR